jgi:hypothetical protein
LIATCSHADAPATVYCDIERCGYLEGPQTTNPVIVEHRSKSVRVNQQNLYIDIFLLSIVLFYLSIKT